MMIMKKKARWEKVLETLGILLILVSIVYKCFSTITDSGTLVILAFMAIMLYVIFLVCAFFPADWRMTSKQKEKIKDMQAYQARYRKILVIINFAISICSSLLIILSR
jgi:Na+-transporting methylmalonyl-CoA/oxaloacetate decarboxylase gamma subunit